MKSRHMVKKGVALLWVVILSSVLIIISSTMVSYIIKESRSSVRIVSSSISYSYAKSGTIWASYHVGNLVEADLPAYTGMGRTFSFDLNKDLVDETTVTIISEGGGNFRVKSVSENNNVVRAIEQIIKKNVKNFIVEDELKLINNDPSRAPLLKLNNNESFELSFVFWAKESSSQEFEIGASATQDFLQQNIQNRIFASIKPDGSENKMKISAVNSGGEYQLIEPDPSFWEEERTNPDPDIDITGYKGYRGYLRYIKDTSAYFRVERVESGKSTCIRAISLDLVGKDFGDLNYLYLNNSSGDNYIYIPSSLVTPPGLFGRNYLESQLVNGVHIRSISIN
jgi:hypothetical protein